MYRKLGSSLLVWGLTVVAWVCGQPEHLGVAAGGLSQAQYDQDWRMAAYDVVASGHNRGESQLGVDNVGDLEVKWVFDDEDAGHAVGPIHATPVVWSSTIFVGSAFGRFYAVARDGRLLWAYETRQPNPLLGAVVIPAPIGGVVSGAVATPVVGAAVLPASVPYVIFGDLDGNIYALDRATGAEVWVKERLDAHPLGGVVGNALLLVDDIVIVGMSSIENVALLLPLFGFPYDCCSHTGLVVALNVNTGEELWRYDTIDPASIQALPLSQSPFVQGPAGADIWGQPTYDVDTHTVYIGTGQNFAPSASGATPASDAIIALDAATGMEKWVTQLTAGDIWLQGMPNPDATGRFFDQDVGDSPKVYTLADGTKVVGAGQKNGIYHVLDAATGAVVVSTPHLQMANSLGGFQQGGAFAGEMVLQHGLDGLTTNGTGPFLGSVMALSLDGRQVRWRFDRFLSPMAGGMAIANGVVYVQSPLEEAIPLQEPLLWALYALDAQSGEPLARVAFQGRALSGPAVSRGRLYIGFGNLAVTEIGEDDTGGLVCLGLPNDGD